MANREGTALSDENMRIHCFEGKAPPLGRLDLLLPPPTNTSKVFYRDPKRIPRMERPISVAAQMENLSRISKTPTDTLFSAYNETRKNKKDVSMKLAQRTYRYNPTTMTIPDITDEIFEELLNAQLYQATPPQTPPQTPPPMSKQPSIPPDFAPISAQPTPKPSRAPSPLQFGTSTPLSKKEQKELAKTETTPSGVLSEGLVIRSGRPIEVELPKSIKEQLYSKEAESIFRSMGQ